MRMSIKHKLTLMMLGISLAAVLLTVTAITAYLIYDIRAAKAQELEVTAALTGDRNAAALVFLDSERAQRNLEIFRLNPSILVACMYDVKGVLFSSYKVDENPDSLTCPQQASDVAIVMPGKLTALREIYQNGEALGKIYVASDTREIDAYVTKIMQISATATLMVFLMTLLLTYYFQRTISGPILELANTAQRITANRDYSLEAKVTNDDETAVLARAFNAMLGEVRKRDEDLMLANETLEQKVVDRTQQLELSTRKAEAASEAKSEFLRNMSHEFRTPLHAIISFSSYGIKEFESSERGQLKQYFELIQKGSERLGRLVNEVLDLAKMEQGEHMFLLKRGDLRELASRSADMVHPLLEDKNITLRFEHVGEAAMAVCDHDKIVQVLTNLLGNAIKFTPAGQGITLRTVTEGDTHVSVSVIDEGIGIPEEEKEAIFESFRQSSRTNTGAGGTGLGLAICRGIIEAHNGTIWADNNDSGKGACVTFCIPAAMEEGTRRIIMNTTETHHEHAA
jgi:signal transduction histidine kinase